MKKNLYILITVFGLIACGSESKNAEVNSVLPNLGDSQKISDVSMRCEVIKADDLNESDGYRIEVKAKDVVFEKSDDYLFLASQIDGKREFSKEFALNERKATFSNVIILPLDRKVVDLEIYTTGSHDITTHLVSFDLTESCDGSQTQVDSLNDLQIK